MPIPNLKNIQIESAADIDAAYAALNWVRELTFKWVQFNAQMNIFTCSVYRAVADRCSCLKEDDPRAGRYTYLQFSEVGILKTCGLCRRTQLYHLLDKFELIETRRISRLEALQICKTTGQLLPPELKPKGPFSDMRKILDIKL